MPAAGDESSSAPILHVDMDAFFASVELRDRPELQHRPVAVGHDGRRGVVTAANYVARRLGVHSAMPMVKARRLVPHLVVLPSTPGVYGVVSESVMRLFGSYTPHVEPLSIDEAFLDVAGSARLYGSPHQIATEIRAKVAAEQRITCSVGAAATKSVAKMASTACKPDGLLVVPADQTQAFLDPHPVGALWGVGPKSADRLVKLGLQTVADIRAVPEQMLCQTLGDAAGKGISRLARGIDPRPVTPRPAEKSVGAERTFAEDLSDPASIERVLLALSQDVAARLRASGVVGHRVGIKLRYQDFHTITRQKRLPQPVDTATVIHQAAVRLLRAEQHRSSWIRLVGVRVEQLTEATDFAEQLVLGQAPVDRRAVDQAQDAVIARFGNGSVQPASLISGKLDALTYRRHMGNHDS